MIALYRSLDYSFFEEDCKSDAIMSNAAADRACVRSRASQRVTYRIALPPASQNLCCKQRLGWPRLPLGTYAIAAVHAATLVCNVQTRIVCFRLVQWYPILYIYYLLRFNDSLPSCFTIISCSVIFVPCHDFLISLPAQILILILLHSLRLVKIKKHTQPKGIQTRDPSSKCEQ